MTFHAILILLIIIWNGILISRSNLFHCVVFFFSHPVDQSVFLQLSLHMTLPHFYYFLIVISPIKFFSTVQHGDPVTYTCTHSIFTHYHAPS